MVTSIKLFHFVVCLVAYVSGASAQVVYIDADVTTNTTLADGTPLVAGTHYYVTPTSAPSDTIADGLWDVRQFANFGSIISSNNGASEDAPALRTTITGLTPGEGVAVYAYLWGGSNADWRLRASLIGPNDDGTVNGEVDTMWSTNYSPNSGINEASFVTQHVTSGANSGPLSTDTTGSDPAFENGGYFSSSIPPVMTVEGNRSLYQASLGTTLADSNGEVHVYIDDRAQASAGFRTWYDGVGYELVDLDILTLEVNELTGTVAIRNNDDVSLNLRYYEIHSESGALNFDASYQSGWAPLDLDPDPQAVTIPGWQVAGGSDAHILSETNFGASLTLEPSQYASLGSAFNVTGQHDLDFYYVPSGSTELTRGIVTYVTAIRGDFNGDGRVDAADYTLWRDNLGATSEAAFAADTGSGDDTIDANDYTLWRTHFGEQGVTTNGLTGNTLAVPEPNAGLMIAMAVILGLLCKRAPQPPSASLFDRQAL